MTILWGYVCEWQGESFLLSNCLRVALTHTHTHTHNIACKCCRRIHYKRRVTIFPALFNLNLKPLRDKDRNRKAHLSACRTKNCCNTTTVIAAVRYGLSIVLLVPRYKSFRRFFDPRPVSLKTLHSVNKNSTRRRRLIENFILPGKMHVLISEQTDAAGY